MRRLGRVGNVALGNGRAAGIAGRGGIPPPGRGHKRYVFQVRAVLERPAANAGNAIGDVDALQARAAVERPFPNAGNAISDGDAA